MDTIAQAFYDGLFADLSYVDKLAPGLTRESLEEAILGRIPQALAAAVGDRFEVLAVTDEQPSDYQAAVFRDKRNGIIYVAHRGTKSSTDILGADVDLALVSGLAKDQTVAMLNWWRDITLPAGTRFEKIAGSRSEDMFIAGGTTVARGTISDAVREASAAGKLRNVGHSLGGHLATILGSLFSGQISHTATFNGAGLYSSVHVARGLWEALAETPLGRAAAIVGQGLSVPDANAMDNFYAVNGPNLTTNALTFVQPGKRIPVYNERSFVVDNHFMYKLTDSLALFRAFEMLDPALDLDRLRGLADASAQTQESSLEGLLDALRATILGPRQAPTPAADVDGVGPERSAYHGNLAALLASPEFEHLRERIALTTSDGVTPLAGMGRFEAFVALNELLPFVATGRREVDGAEATLREHWAAKWGDTHTAWRADLDLRERGFADDATFSVSWYEDRRRFLNALASTSLADSSAIFSGGNAPLWAYEDRRLGKSIAPRPYQVPITALARMTFGTDGADTVDGSLYGDHLYGMSGDDIVDAGLGGDYAEGGRGADVLNGGAGNDWILGGADDDRVQGGDGNDVLRGGDGLDQIDGDAGVDVIFGGNEADAMRGGAGRDRLVGDAGNDALTGGPDDDALFGGAGVDSYILAPNEGTDTIEDADGKGELRVGADRITGGDPDGAGVWRGTFRNAPIKFAFDPDASGRGDLVVVSAVGTTIVRDFKNGDLSIVLTGKTDDLPDAPAPTSTIGGTAQDDNRNATGGRKPIVGTVGNERVRALAGRDEAAAGAGDDVVEGGPGVDVLAGEAGKDAVFADVETSEAQLRDLIATSAVAPTDGAAPARLEVAHVEWLRGGLADDTVVGAGGNDVLFGGGGADLLVGGTGHDLINGDDDYEPADIDTVYVEPGAGNGGPFDAWYSSVIIHDYAGDVGASDEIHAGSGDDNVYAEVGDDTVWGDDGNDTIAGGDDDDTLFGNAGNDRLTGDDYGLLVGSDTQTPIGDDYLDGGAGNDSLYGDGGSDILIGGAGDDIIRGNNDVGGEAAAQSAAADGDDWLAGDDGDDILVGDAAADTLIGDAGDDQLFGDSDSTPVAFHGNDDLRGGVGNDYLRGYGGDDTLDGGEGDDIVHAEDGADTIIGGAGNDAIDAGAGADTISAGLGEDSIQAGAGDDVVSGDESDDRLAGGAGLDSLAGGDGNDALWGEEGADTIFGEAGDDQLAGGADDDVLAGGIGNDWLWGDAGNDQLDAGDGDDGLSGGLGADTLLAGSGTDFLRGEAGDDTLVAGVGTSILQGGAGNDRYIVPAYARNVYISDGEGQNRVEFEDETKLEEINFWLGQDETGNTSHLVVTRGDRPLAVIENGFGTANAPSIRLADGHVVTEWEILAKLATHSVLNANHAAISLTPPTGNATYVAGQYDQKRVWANNPQAYVPITLPSVSVLGSSADDAIAGMGGAVNADAGQGNDSMIGAYARDDLRGGAGNDMLSGFDAADTLAGGDGNDSLTGGNGADRLDGGAGDDVLVGGEDEDVLFAGPGNDRIEGGAARDQLVGDAGDDVLDGGSGSDVLDGGAGADRLTGAAGNDTLDGGDGSDTLDAGEGNDRLGGGAGDDLLVGGAGDDVFVIDGRGHDRIRDEAGIGTLHFGAGIDEARIAITRGTPGSADEFAYRLDFGGGNDVVIEDAVRTGGTRVAFADGRRLSMADLLSARFTLALTLTVDAQHRRLAGGAGDDRLMGATITAEIDGGGGSDTLLGAAARDRLVGAAGADTLYGGAESDWLEGGAGDDALRGDAGADRLFGDADADTLEGGDDADVILGGAGADHLDGGAGNDLLAGGGGDDVYRLGAGAGMDAVTDDEGSNAVEFAAGIAPASVSFKRAASGDGKEDLVAQLADGSELWLRDAGRADVVSQFRFADGSRLTLAEVRALATTSATPASAMQTLVVGTGGGDRIVALRTSTVALGLAGDDVITGARDVDGGAGSDTLVDGHVYRFGRGDGVDTIEHENSRGSIYYYDRYVEFKPGIRESDLDFARRGDDLVIRIKGTDDALTVRKHFVDYGATMFQDQRPHAIAGLRFADGTSRDYASIANLFRAGTSGDDDLVNVAYGGEGNDVMRRESSWGDMHGEDGDDWMSTASGMDDDTTRLWGEGGNDTLFAASGRGSDIGLYGGPGDDVLHGAANTRMIGGPGDDRLYVGHGAIVVVDRDEGHDRVMTSAPDLGLGVTPEFRLRMSTGVYEDLRPLREGDDLRLTIRDRDSSLLIPDFFAPDGRFGGLSAITVSRRIDFDGFALDQSTDIAPEALAERAVSVAVTPMTFEGTDATDRIIGTSADDVLRGGAGNDEIDGLSGNDAIDGGAGSDLLVGRSGNDRIDAGPGRNQVYPGFGDDVVTAGDDRDYIVDPGGQNAIDAGGGDDIVRTGSGVSTIVGGAGDDEIKTYGGVASGDDGDDLLYVMGTDAATLRGGAGSDDISANGSGDYVVAGGPGLDTIHIRDAHRATIEVESDSGHDSVTIATDATTNPRLVEIRFAAGIAPSAVTLRRVADATGHDHLDVGAHAAGASLLMRYALTRTESRVAAMHFADGTTWSADDILAKTRAGSDAADFLVGGPGNDHLVGGAGNDTMRGEGGNDLLDGGEDGDTMYGGAGDDVYLVDSQEDRPQEYERGDTGGNDEVRSTVSHALAPYVERLALLGSADLAGYGNELDNVITGNDGANVLEGRGGADRLSGGRGNDTYDIGDHLDTIVELPGEGIDTFVIHDSTTLPANIENLTMAYEGTMDGTGNALDNVLTGNLQKNTLLGMDGNDVLIGCTGGDVLAGGRGDDTYRVYDGDDSIVEHAGEGVDRVESSVNHTLGANLEQLTLVGGTTATGNALANALTGNAGSNTLDGREGADTMTGLGGNDTYIVSDAGDTIVEATAAGTDLVVAAIDYVLPGNVENLTLTGASALRATGNALANVLLGNALGNTLDGLAGNDTLKGGAGNDSYVVDASGDAITELAAEGSDTVHSSVTLTLAANVENLVLTGTAAIHATGNALANGLTGNAGSNTLNGAAGADTMRGGAGNDTYVVDHAADVIVEAVNEGVDLVQTSLAHVLAANVENLTLTGTASVAGTGNVLTNVLTGNAGNNVLDGKGGIDTLKGGTGNDTYVVDTIGDAPVEAAGAGTDLVQASVSATLAANVENLTLTGASAIDASGNTLANVLVGNGAANVLNGGGGTDTMRGAAGDDTYVVDVATDVVSELASEGTDTIQSPITWTLGANVERLTLTGGAAVNATGNTLANVLTGNAAANVLDGAGGADAMAGGGGNDTYRVDNTGDTVTEAAGAGTDRVETTITYVLPANVENLTLIGSGSIGGTGNALANAITGNAAANVINGGAGNDTMRGGAGDDTYVVDVAADVVSELAGEGVDLVQSAVTLTLGANLEKLTLTGSAASNGTGNALDNTLVGNAAANVLDGGVGADTMAGGSGDDTYVVAQGGDTVSEAAGGGNDTVNAGITYVLPANVEHLLQTGVAAVGGTGNTLANWIRGNTAGNALNGGESQDTLFGNAGNDALDGGAGNDLVQGGTGNDALIDRSGNNLLDGGTGTDTLTGGAGREILVGGTGADTITTGGGADIIVFNKGDGADVVIAGAGSDDTLSLGGAFVYGDLKLRKSGLDLVLDAGTGDQITFRNWYETGINNKSVLNLQVVADAMAAFDPASADPRLNRKVVRFNFGNLVSQFDAALAANPALSAWSLGSSLASAHLAGSDTAAIGGDLAYEYGHRNAFSGIGALPAQALLAASSFAATPQTLQSAATLHSGSVRMS